MNEARLRAVRPRFRPPLTNSVCGFPLTSIPGLDSRWREECRNKSREATSGLPDQIQLRSPAGDDRGLRREPKRLIVGRRGLGAGFGSWV